MFDQGEADGGGAAADSWYGRKPLITRAPFIPRLACRRDHVSSYHRRTAPGSLCIAPMDYWIARERLLRDFAVYCNDYRGHTTLGGAVPAVMYRGERWDKPAKSAKTLPTNLERRVFPDTKITAYRLAA